MPDDPELDVDGLAVLRNKVTIGSFDPSWVPFAAQLEVSNSTEGGANNSHAVNAFSKTGVAVSATSATTYGVVASGGFKAAWFRGDVLVDGKLTKSTLEFTIDHPLEPEDKYLSHAAVESDEMKNVYDGEAVLDGTGSAEIVLPDWFQALNERFRYQLTAIGRAAPRLHVARELEGNRFAIAGGEPGTRVCWQVTGVRQDPYARTNPLVVESAKNGDERGRYRHPEAYGLTAERRIAPLPAYAAPGRG
ncbi:hypothetical protein ACFV7Q_30585 [Streptomyces sp. NPDC059851]|uniref:hypothetical protein n=1 Tax=Streptomyces sp. NPDC059851 TaxID=3346971 RepID=UPI003657B48F